MSFDSFAQSLSQKAGSSWTFIVALALIIVWACTGPIFHYNDTWQLIINTSTTIITFLMVFLIQHTQNRDNDVLHIKVDELLRSLREAQNAVLDLDGLNTKELAALREAYKKIGAGETIKVEAVVEIEDKKTD